LIDFTLRPVTPADCRTLAEIHIEGWQTAYAGFMPLEFLAGLDLLKQETWLREWIFDANDPLIGLAAEVGGEIAGFALAGLNTGEPLAYDAELYKLFVRPAWQNQGLGELLTQAALAQLRQQGYQKVCIWTFRQSRSGRFYRKLGYPVVYQAEIEFGGMKHAVDVYGGNL
jgi:GNAT superfamily N-acetyltransferase